MRRQTLIQSSLAVALAVCALVLAAPTAHAQRGQDGRNGDFGLGLMFGAPTGLSAKYYFGHLAIDAGLGVFRAFPSHEGTHLHADLLWHPRMLVNTQHFTLPFYFGVGARLLEHSWGSYFNNRQLYFESSDTHLGVRAPVGLVMNFKRVPLDVFFEVALVADLIVGGDAVCRDSQGRLYDCAWHHHLLDFNGALGVRYYF